MNFKKSLLAVSCTITLLATSALTGCAQKSAENPAASPTQSAVKSGEKEPITLKFLNGTDKFNPEEDYTRKLINDVLGVNLIPSMGNEPDKVNLILSSAQEYDMIVMSAKERNALGAYIRNGAIQPLNEAIDKFGPNLKNA
ncbi:MAG: hypothetical protein H7X86_06635, partial [Gorillibacterium sp.]|nr:hypothetical protein [Gorillibacterium sp.]